MKKMLRVFVALRDGGFEKIKIVEDGLEGGGRVRS